MPTSIADAFRSFLPWAAIGTASTRDGAASIYALEPSTRELSSTELREHVDQLRVGMADRGLWESPSLLFRGVSLFKEAARRTVGVEYYDVQLMAALTLTRNAVAEMSTGEGKTYVGALAAFVHGLSGGGVHVMTTNTYLAERDYEIAKPIFDAVGMSLALLRDQDSPSTRRMSYHCDVTYGPGYEFGFDYLRDQTAMAQRPEPKLGEDYRRQSRGGSPTPSWQTLQRGQQAAIVDEADSVFIDEANTPLLLSGPASPTNAYPQIYQLAICLVDSLTCGTDFVLDAKSHTPALTKQGLSRAMAEFDKVAQTQLRQPWPVYVEQALVATVLFKRDVHYVVDDDKVKIVDNSTGRIFADRTWRGGLHQMVEAKEGVPITTETTPLARISRQQYFRRYSVLCG